MTSARLVIWLLVGWVACFALSVIHPMLIEPERVFPVEGLNRLPYIFGWLYGALVVAITALIVRMKRGAGLPVALRRLCIPMPIVSIVMIAWLYLALKEGLIMS